MKASSDFSQSLVLSLEATPENYEPRLGSPQSARNKSKRISSKNFDALNIIWSPDVWELCIT